MRNLGWCFWTQTYKKKLRSEFPGKPEIWLLNIHYDICHVDLRRAVQTCCNVRRAWMSARVSARSEVHFQIHPVVTFGGSSGIKKIQKSESQGSAEENADGSRHLERGWGKLLRSSLQRWSIFRPCVKFSCARSSDRSSQRPCYSYMLNSNSSRRRFVGQRQHR